MRNSIIIGLSCAAMLSSCGRVFKGTSDKKIAQQDSALAHKWQSDCASNDVLNISHAKRTVTIDILGNFEKAETYYNSDKCEGSQLTYKVLGTYATLGSLVADSDIKKVNFTVNKAVMKPQSADTAKALNALKFCGLDDWQQGVEVDITGKDCKGFVVKRGDVVFDVYKIEERILYFGHRFLFLVSGNLAKRPEQVDTNIPYRR